MENINSIAEELNVGLDSFVFLDDSMFEIDNIKNKDLETAQKINDQIFSKHNKR